MEDKFKIIRNQEHILKELAKKNSPYRVSILKKANPELILAICEVIYNILSGNINLTKSQKEILIKEKKLLRNLVERNKITYKKKLLVQKGGFILPLLLPIALSAIASSIFS